MRQLLGFIIFLSLISCNEQKEPIEIHLASEKGYGSFMVGRGILFPNNDSINYRGVPSSITEYVVRSIHLQPEQSVWEKYREGKIDQEYFLAAKSQYEIDTTKLSRSEVKEEVILLIGTNNDNKRVIIVDTDSDRNFQGEEILEYEYPLSVEKQKEIDESLPVVSVSYEYFDGREIIKRSANLKPSPYKGSLGLSFNTDNEVEKEYYLFVSFPEHRKGTLNIDDTQYDVLVANGFAKVPYIIHNTSIFIKKQGELPFSEVNGDIPYNVGDIFNSNGLDYLIEGISLWGDTLKLKYLGENIHPVGITEGMFVPKFNAKKLDNSVFELDEFSDKYVLIDFWGTWCKPCIEFIPELKELNNDYSGKNLALVSVAFDRDIEKVDEFVKKENMDWVHVFADQKVNDPNSIIEKLKITIYPTTILISPNGEIIARNKDIKELREILDKELTSL